MQNAECRVETNTATEETRVEESTIYKEGRKTGLKMKTDAGTDFEQTETKETFTTETLSHRDCRNGKKQPRMDTNEYGC
jgi:hypothetical protein